MTSIVYRSAPTQTRTLIQQSADEDESGEHPTLESCQEEDSNLSHHIRNMLAELKRKQQIINTISRDCTEANIRKKYSDMEIKEITYDPSLYSVIATEALGIHRRILKMFGTDVIRLQDPEFIEHSLQIMLEQEAAAEAEATARRKKRGEESEWNAEKKALFAVEVRKMLNTVTTDTSKQPTTKVSNKVKKKMGGNWGLAMTYHHHDHDFHISDTKYKVDSSVWEEEEDSLGPDKVSLLFEHADSVIIGPDLPKHGLKMKRLGCDFDISTIPVKEEEEEEEKTQTNKSNNMGKNNSSKKMSHREKHRKSILNTSSQQLFSERASSFSDKSRKLTKLKSQKVAIKDIEEDDRSMYEPLKVKPEEKKLVKPSLDSQY